MPSINPTAKAATTIAACFAFLFFMNRSLDSYQVKQETQELYRAGFKKASASLYSSLKKNQIFEPNQYFNYAVILSELKMSDSALNQLRLFKKFIYNDKTASLFGELYFQKGNLMATEQFYRQAVFINPKSFKNRFQLFNYYVETRQADKAKFWGLGILQLKPKIKGKSVARIKKNTAAILFEECGILWRYDN